MTDFSGNNRTQRLCRHRKAPSRRIVERRTGDPATDSRVTVLIAEGKGTALRNAEARRRRSKSQEIPPSTRSAEVGASATSVGVRSILHTSTVACAETLSTRFAIVRSEELRRAGCWQKRLCRQILRWD